VTIICIQLAAGTVSRYSVSTSMHLWLVLALFFVFLGYFLLVVCTSAVNAGKDFPKSICYVSCGSLKSTHSLAQFHLTNLESGCHGLVRVQWSNGSVSDS